MNNGKSSNNILEEISGDPRHEFPKEPVILFLTNTNNEICRSLPNFFELIDKDGNQCKILETVFVQFGGYNCPQVIRYSCNGEIKYISVEIADSEFKLNDLMKEVYSKSIKDLTKPEKALLMNYEILKNNPNCETNYPPEDKRIIKQC